MPLKRTAPRLSFAEAYHAAQSFLAHLGEAPSRLDEPADGIVDLESGELFSRLRYDDTPIGQGGILGLLKATEGMEKIPILFSASGFSGSAEVFGKNLHAALFSITTEGDIVPRSPAAHHLMPIEPFDPPFAELAENDPEQSRPDGVWIPGESAEEIADHEWIDCPACGTTHHPEANFCHRCGATLATKRRLSPASAGRRRKPPKAVVPPSDRAEPRGETHEHPGPRTMRCRNCGSDDVEVLE